MADQRGAPARRQFVNYLFLKVRGEWRRLPADERAAGKAAFTAVIEEYAAGGMLIIPYSLVGLRGDADLMLWRISETLEPLQEMAARLLATPLGVWCDVPYSYLSQSKRSVYVDKLDPEHDTSRMRIQPGRYRYNFVYPFVKTRAWYLLHKQARQGIMDEHIEVGNQYPSVKLNTTYSFGLDDQEFMLAFETDEPGDFVDLVMHLRETEGSRYTERDTPIFTCVRKTVAEMLDLLGA